MPTVPKIVADFTTQLATSIAVGGTTATIASQADDDGNNAPDGLYYFTIDGNNSSKEFISCTKTGTSLSAIKTVSRQGAEVSGVLRAHRIGALVVMTDFATYKAYIDAISLQGAANASDTVAGVTKLSVAPADPAEPKAVGDNDPRVPTADPTTLFIPLSGITGLVSPYAGRTAPSGWLLCDGSAVSRSTYAALFAVIAPSQTFTVTIASPGVFSATAHGLVAGDKIHFTTTGGLPSGLATNTDYYVISTGLTADAFEVALVPGGAAVNTSGSQSGVHTMYKSGWGKGDGSTTFNIPDLRSKVPVGRAASAPTIVLKFESAQVNTTDNTVTIVDTIFPAQGQAVALTTNGGTLPTGLSATTYYIIRASSTTIKFATSLANAQVGTAVDITGAGSGNHSLTFTVLAQTVIGLQGGEEQHTISQSEMAAHSHTVAWSDVSNGGSGGNTRPTLPGPTSTSSVGGDQQHNNMQPFAVINYIIKT